MWKLSRSALRLWTNDTATRCHSPSRKGYEDLSGTVALDGVDFNIYRGKVNVLIGENGAGKSTLMKILAGVESATSGRLLLEGKDIAA